MIKPIITNKIELAQPSYTVALTEVMVPQTLTDLVDTAEHYRLKPIGCVGLAANQIGELFRVIVVWNGGNWIRMINPIWKARDSKMGLSHEACLSRPGVKRKIKRHKRILVNWWTEDGDVMEQKFSGFTARIIQHECDHLDGVFI